jgi:hypothetical protein
LSQYDCNETDVWDCHGTWVAYHRTLEKIAAKTNITFDMPTIIESDCGKGVVAICVAGHMDKRTEWSFGEAAPKNNKNAYPYAMAEKRAKDRVILKLVGLHGLVYSEEESETFKRNGAPANIDADDDEDIERALPHPMTVINGDRQTPYYARKDGLDKLMMSIQREMRDAKTKTDLTTLYKRHRLKISEMPPEWQNTIYVEFDDLIAKFNAAREPENIMGAG